MLILMFIMVLFIFLFSVIQFVMYFDLVKKFINRLLFKLFNLRK